MQDLAKEIKDMRMDRMRESPGRFHVGEGFYMSHHWTSQPMIPSQTHQVSQCSTMPSFLAVENEGPQEQASLEDYFVEYDSKS